MNRPTCLSCPYHARNPQTIGEPGECRAPGRVKAQLVIDPRGGPMVFPLVLTTPSDYWCGDHPMMAAYAAWFLENRSGKLEELTAGGPGIVNGQGDKGSGLILRE